GGRSAGSHGGDQSAPQSDPASGHGEGVSRVLAKASGRVPAIVARRFSNGSAGTVRPPTLTPRLRTIWVSNGFVSIATRNPHSGQRNVTDSEPSSGPSVECSFIGWSQSRQRNFMRDAFYHRARDRRRRRCPAPDRVAGAAR